MKEIKFRFWDLEDKEMSYHDLYAFEAMGIRSIPADIEGDYEIMQFTGLVDTHGQDIYEGDIIEYLETTSMGVVKKRVVIRDIRRLPDFSCSKWEHVLGNIYEQPELVEDVG